MWQPRVESRASPQETHVQRFILGSNQAANISSLHEHVYTSGCTRVRTHTHTSVCMGGFESRDSVGQAPSADGCRASGEEQVWTANPQLLPKQRGMRCKSTKMPFTEEKLESRLMILSISSTISQSVNFLNHLKALQPWRGAAPLPIYHQI